MLKHPRKTIHAGTLRTLNQPRPLTVTTDSRGLPRCLVLRDHQFEVVAIQDLWRIDNDWWRPQPISRLYYEVVLNNGLVHTIYCDLITGAWYSQRY